MLNSYIGQDRTKKGSRLNSGHILNKIKFSNGSSLFDNAYPFHIVPLFATH